MRDDFVLSPFPFSSFPLSQLHCFPSYPPPFRFPPHLHPTPHLSHPLPSPTPIPIPIPSMCNLPPIHIPLIPFTSLSPPHTHSLPIPVLLFFMASPKASPTTTIHLCRESFLGTFPGRTIVLGSCWRGVLGHRPECAPLHLSEHFTLALLMLLLHCSRGL